MIFLIKIGGIEMKKKTLLIITISICLVLVIILIIVMVNQNKPLEENRNNLIPGTTYNNNDKVVEDKNINNITFTNIECSYDGNNSLLSYTITNKTQAPVTLGEYEIIVKDKDGEILTNLVPQLDMELKPGESFDTGVSVNIDLSDAYEIELVLGNE